MRVISYSLEESNKVRIKYKGFLNQEDIDQLYLHTGLGYGVEWKNISDIKMKEDNNFWVADVDITQANSCLNFCFKSEEEQWDNNGGENWKYKILKVN